MKLQHSTPLVRKIDRLCHVPAVGAVVGLVSPHLVFRRVKSRLETDSPLPDLEKQDVIDIFAKRGTKFHVKFAFENLSPDLDSQRKLALRLLDLVCFDFDNIYMSTNVLSPGLPIAEYSLQSVVLVPCDSFLLNVSREIVSIPMDMSIKEALKKAVSDPFNYSLRDALHAKQTL